ncbi:MAG: hypothetical protein FK734_10955 [Asgard group archaeon]|nr:hypothetical protein [Asgard group archaeon]
MPDPSSDEIITPYLTEEVLLKKKTPFHAQMAIFRLKAWRMLAHHPTCSRYKNHYFSIGKLHLCIGCSMIYSALIIYTILFFSLPEVFRYNLYVISILPFAGFGLAITHLLFKFKNKWIKAFLRFIAGFGIGAYCAVIIIGPYWWARVLLAFLLLAGNQLYGMSRGRGANRKICDECELQHADPPCNPDRNTNIRIRKIYTIIEEELQKAREKQASNDENTGSSS